MPVGSIILVTVAVLIYLGLGQRVLDRMRMTDRAALGWIVAMVLGGFINITLLRRPTELIVNLGGGVVPLVWAGYLLATADSAWEKTRSLLAAAITLLTVYAIGKLMPAEPTDMFLMDPLYIYALVAAVVAYLFGRSRRAAFIAAIIGVVGLDLVHLITLMVRGIPGRTWIGGAGAFDATVIAGFLAVGLAEVVGETRERAVRGPDKEGDDGNA